MSDQVGCEWVSVSSGTGLPRLSWTKAVKRLCVCVCVCVCCVCINIQASFFESFVTVHRHFTYLLSWRHANWLTGKVNSLTGRVVDKELNLWTHRHTHPFNGRLPVTSRLSQYQKGKTDLDFTEARDSEWQWNLLLCTSFQTDNHACSPPLSFYRPNALSAAQPTVSKH